MSKLRGDGDQILNFVYKSYFDSEVMAMSGAHLHTPGYLYADVTINSPGANQLTIDELAAVIYPTNPRNTFELIKMHTTTSFATSALVAATDDFLVCNLTHIPADDTVAATITTKNAAGLLSTDVVVCEIEYTGPNISGLNYDHISVTKCKTLPSWFKAFRYDDDGVPGNVEGYDTLVQFGNKSFVASATAVVTFPTEFPAAIQSITVTPEIAADAQWRISTSATTGFTVTFDAPATGLIYWESKGY